MLHLSIEGGNSFRDLGDLAVLFVVTVETVSYY